jgi:hypothetical protein
LLNHRSAAPFSFSELPLASRSKNSPQPDCAITKEKVPAEVEHCHQTPEYDGLTMRSDVVHIVGNWINRKRCRQEHKKVEPLRLEPTQMESEYQDCGEACEKNRCNCSFLFIGHFATYHAGTRGSRR